MTFTKQAIMDIERYQRAASFLPQVMACGLSGTFHEGYWIDSHRFFFCVSDVVEGCLRRVPKIADAASAEVLQVLTFEALSELIVPESGAQVSLDELNSARYEMPDAKTLLVLLGTECCRIDLAGPTLVERLPLDQAMAVRSPDGQHACFLQGANVWVKDLASGATKPVTSDGEDHYAYGVEPESGTTPLASRKRRMPWGLWSRDSKWFVTHRIDERALPQSGLVEHAPADGGRPVAHLFKVAGPNDDPPRAEYVAWHLPSGKVVRSGDRKVLTQSFSPFAARHCWLTDDQVFFLDWDRFSSSVSLVAMDLASGAVRTVLTETAECGWIDLHPFLTGQPMVRPLAGSNEVIWYSQADGRGHLYLYDLATGVCKNRITQGSWVVREIVRVDAAKRRLLFLASGFEGDRDPGQRRLCAVNLDGSGFETLYGADGDLSVKPDPVSSIDQFKPFRPSYALSGASADGRYVAASVGSIDTPTRWLLIDIEGERQIEIARIDIDTQWHAPKPRPFEALASDGKTKLVGAMYFPSNFDPSASYPLVDYIYPGPQMNWLARRFPNSIALTLQSVVELGMVGIVLETRGMPNRDRAFHQAGRGRLLEPQLSDHATVIEQLCERHSFLDRDRVGIFGQSGGGHAAARALFDYPDMFKVAVSVCGNHDSRNYIAHWIDKYGGRPGTSERNDQANASAAHQLRGKLLLMHGDMDENVHPGHTLALSAALIAAGKEFDQLIIPGATHAVLQESPYAIQRIWAYFGRHLLGIEPPAGFKLEWTTAGMAAGQAMQADQFA